MRGKEAGGNPRDCSHRITPAYAGKSYVQEYSPLKNEDHPRLCGEKIFPESKTSPVQGSPPPMRGKVLRYISCSVVLGITPAYAGKRGFGLFPNLCI